MQNHVQKPGAVASGQRGAVMFVVAGVMAVVMVVAFSLIAIGYKNLQSSADYVRHVRSELLAGAAVERAIAILRADRNGYDTLLEAWRTNTNELRTVTEGYGVGNVVAGRIGGIVRSGIEDEESKVNVNLAPPAMLAALPGVSRQLAAAIVEARRRPFATPDDILRIDGMTPAMYAGDAKAGSPGLRELITVWGSGSINVNTAPGQVLAAIPGLNAAQVAGIIGRRSRLPGPSSGPFRSAAEVLAFLRLPADVAQQVRALISVRSTVFRLVAAGRAVGGRDGEQAVHIAAVIDRAAQPLRILYWRQLSARPLAARVAPVQALDLQPAAISPKLPQPTVQPDAQSGAQPGIGGPKREQ